MNTKAFHLLDLKDQKEVIFQLRLKYQKLGFVDGDIYSEADRLDVGVLDLIDHIAGRSKLGRTVAGVPVSVAILEPLQTNDDPPTYHLSKVPISEYPNWIRRRDGCNNHIGRTRWMHMNGRCNSPTNPFYHNYGGRGILVCDAWHHLNPEGRSNYCRWMDSRDIAVGDAVEVDRRNNDENYYPGNCRLVSRAINSQNTRLTKLTEDDVLNLRKYIRRIDVVDRSKFCAVEAGRLNCTQNALINAMTGKTWSNVNHIEEPVVVCGGKTGPEVRISDDMIIRWRDIVRDTPREHRPAKIQSLADRDGFNVHTVRSCVTGWKGKHLNDVCLPVHTRRVLSDDLMEELVAEYRKIWKKETLNGFCIRKSKDLGVSRGTLYDRLTRRLPEYMWRTRLSKHEKV